MVYPKFMRKFRKRALFGPESSLDLRRRPQNLPKRYIFIYENETVDQLKKTYDLTKVDLSNGLFELYSLRSVGIAKINGIGSPHAVSVLEDIIHLGGDTFLNLGLAGGLKNLGIFLCSKALRDEGTSYHYVPSSDYSYPDRNLTEKFADTLKKLGIEFKIAPSWTTDAPYRETEEEIEKYKKKNIATVDMETSALFAVAKKRKVRIASSFVVSDLLASKRETRNREDYMGDLNKIVEAGILCLN